MRGGRGTYDNINVPLEIELQVGLGDAQVVFFECLGVRGRDVLELFSEHGVGEEWVRFEVL